MAKLRLTAHTANPTMSGAIITKTGHSGRLRSCSMESNTTIAKGISVIKSSTAPAILLSMISSLEERQNIGRYHTWLKVMLANKAAVQRRRRIGDVMSGAMALARRNSR